MSQPAYVHHYQPPATPGAPVWVLLHGTGGHEHQLVPAMQRVDPGAGWLGLRGPVLEGTMARFFRRIREGVFDLESLQAETVRFHTFLGQARAAYQLEQTPLMGLGFSNGANLLASYLLSGGTELAGAVLWRAQTPFTPQTNKVRTTPVLLISGKSDPIVPLADAQRLARLLTTGGAEVDHQIIPTGHALTNDDFVHTACWLQALRAGGDPD